MVDICGIRALMVDNAMFLCDGVDGRCRIEETWTSANSLKAMRVC
jgi:hypothetical protein